MQAILATCVVLHSKLLAVSFLSMFHLFVNGCIFVCFNEKSWPNLLPHEPLMVVHSGGLRSIPCQTAPWRIHCYCKWKKIVSCIPKTLVLLDRRMWELICLRNEKVPIRICIDSVILLPHEMEDVRVKNIAVHVGKREISSVGPLEILAVKRMT